MPASAPDTALTGGPSQRIALRRSAALHLAAVFFIVVAVAAVWMTVAPRVGTASATAAGVLVFAILAWSAVRHAHDQPGALKIGPDWLSIWNRAGILRAQGRITGCSQWSDSLLMLRIEEDSGALHRVLIAADMLEQGDFRRLAVLARHSAHI